MNIISFTLYNEAAYKRAMSNHRVRNVPVEGTVHAVKDDGEIVAAYIRLKMSRHFADHLHEATAFAQTHASEFEWQKDDGWGWI